MGALDEYLVTLDDPARSAYERVRDLVLAEVPDAEQGTSYGMAVLKHRGKPLLGFKAAKGHLSVFPFSPQAVDQAVDAVASELAGFDVSKGTIRFDAGHPLPEAVVRAVVRARLAEIDAARR